MMTFLRTIGIAALASFLNFGAAHAVTFTFDGTVYDTAGLAATPGDPNFPPLGTAATVTLSIADGDPLLPVFTSPVTVQQVFSASLSVPGYLGGSMANDAEVSGFNLTEEFLQFGAYGSSFINDPGTESFRFEGYHVFRVNFGSPLAAIPLTIGDVVSAVGAPGASGFFSHELESDAGGGFNFTRVSFLAETVEVVPLPASGWLMALILGGFGWVARRRKVA